MPPNDKPLVISYEDARKVLETFVDNLDDAEKTLAKVDTSDVKLPLRFGRIRLDLDGNGESAEGETLWRIFQLFNAGVRQVDAEAFRIVFDGGDVHWLRGYCHLLMAMAEGTLAYDWRDLFERTAHLFYPKVKTPHAYLQKEGVAGLEDFDARNVLDLVAFVHLINFPLKEPKRMRAALGHFEAMVEQSRASWKRILAETDDDCEWLPNPQQTGVIPNVRVRREMIDGWHEFLGEMESLLAGRKLVPFWRGSPKRAGFNLPAVNPEVGINLRKVFTEPRRFDLVMWIHGTAATPFLEKGTMTDYEVWERLSRVFGGEFFGFAIWFN